MGPVERAVESLAAATAAAANKLLEAVPGTAEHQLKKELEEKGDVSVDTGEPLPGGHGRAVCCLGAHRQQCRELVGRQGPASWVGLWLGKDRSSLSWRQFPGRHASRGGPHIPSLPPPLPPLHPSLFCPPVPTLAADRARPPLQAVPVHSAEPSTAGQGAAAHRPAAAQN